MLNKKVEEALNAQINAEFWSAYLYLSMSAYFEAEGKSGFANWFRVQFKEEQAHAEIFMNFIQSRGGRVILKAIDEVPTSWESPLDVFKETLKHEQKVTSLINELYSIAEEAKDYATRNTLTWFIDEQVEEEKLRRSISTRSALSETTVMAYTNLTKNLPQGYTTFPRLLQTRATNQYNETSKRMPALSPSCSFYFMLLNKLQ